MNELIENVRPKDSDNPLVTFAVFAYNHERYIREAVEGALSQTYTPLEIIISDDCSIDQTFDLVKEMLEGYSGPHALRVICNKQNLGVCAHVNAVAAVASGDLLVLAAGDDVSESDRVKEVVNIWNLYKPSAIYSNAVLINENGQNIGEWNVVDEDSGGVVRIDKEEDVVPPRFYGAGAAYARTLFTMFGPLPTDVRNEDFNLVWRALMSNGIAYVSKKVVRYRKHEENLSFWVKLSNARSIRKRVVINSHKNKNEMKNWEHIASYAIDLYGESSPIVDKIRRLARDRSRSVIQLYYDETRACLVRYVSLIEKFLCGIRRAL